MFADLEEQRIKEMIEGDNDGHGSGVEVGEFNTSATSAELSDVYLMEDGNNGERFEDSFEKLRTQADVELQVSCLHTWKCQNSLVTIGVSIFRTDKYVRIYQ